MIREDQRIRCERSCLATSAVTISKYADFLYKHLVYIYGDGESGCDVDSQ